MLEEMTLFCLMLMLIGHGMLIRGCTSIGTAIPVSTDRIETKFTGIATILDELADLIHELGSGPPTTAMQNASIGGSIPEMLSAFLMNKAHMNNTHGPQTQQREIYEIDPQTKNETEDKFD
jgi:hypothetical protein